MGQDVGRSRAKIEVQSSKRLGERYALDDRVFCESLLRFRFSDAGRRRRDWQHAARVWMGLGIIALPRSVTKHDAD